MTNSPAGVPFLRPVAQESTPMIIAGQVRDAVARGDFPPGAQLHEVELARQLGVSRGPLREGLQRLTQEGLLTSVRHRGVFVVELTADNVRDMYLARSAIERAACAVVVATDPVGTAAALGVVLEEMAEAARGGSSRGVAEADIRFHEALVERTGSERLARIHATQAAEARICIHALGSTYEDDLARVDEHRRIAAAIGRGDPDEADRLLVLHMDDAVAELAQLSATTTSGAPPVG